MIRQLGAKVCVLSVPTERLRRISQFVLPHMRFIGRDHADATPNPVHRALAPLVYIAVRSS
jgi:hypothetical protein